jgi:hypothetical protein
MVSFDGVDQGVGETVYEVSPTAMCGEWPSVGEICDDRNGRGHLLKKSVTQSGINQIVVEPCFLNLTCRSKRELIRHTGKRLSSRSRVSGPCSTGSSPRFTAASRSSISAAIMASSSCRVGKGRLSDKRPTISSRSSTGRESNWVMRASATMAAGGEECSGSYVDPAGFSSLCFGGSIIMSSRAAPAGIMGKTFSVLMHSASMRQGPSL